MGWQDAPVVVDSWQDAPVVDDEKRKPSTIDRAQAGASAVNRTMLADLPGLPVDTALNVWDLLKAGAGTVGGAFGVKADNLPELTKRDLIPGSSEWLANRMRSAGIGIDPNRPDDAASRYIAAGARGATSALAMGPSRAAGDLMRNAVMGGASMISGQAAQEAGADTAGTILATMGPAAAITAAGKFNAGYQQRQAQRKADNAVRDANIREAQEAGYVFPPSQTNPSMVNKLVEGWSGKIATEQAASLKNMARNDALVREDLRLPPTAPLTVETFGKVRSEAGKVYGEVERFGRMNWDRDYVRDWMKIRNEYEMLARNSEQLRVPAAEQAIKDAFKPNLDSKAAIELVKQWRKDGYANFNSGDPEKMRLGKVQLDIQNALDDLVSRNLQRSGNRDLFDRYQDARVQIAKTYTAENALDKATGHIDAGKLAAAYQKGKPISGGMEKAAKAAGIAPQSTKDLRRSPPGTSVLDWAVTLPSVGAAIGTGNPMFAAGALLPATRPVMRSGILSDPYQRMMAQPPSRAPGMLSRGVRSLFDEENYGLLGPLVIGQ